MLDILKLIQITVSLIRALLSSLAEKHGHEVSDRLEEKGLATVSQLVVAWHSRLQTVIYHYTANHCVEGLLGSLGLLGLLMLFKYHEVVL